MALRIFILLLISITSVCTNASSAKSLSNEITTLTDKYFALVENTEYLKAAGLFHYPPSYSTDQTIEDMKGVSKFITALTDSFGTVNNPVENTAGIKIISLQIGGGDIPYWKKHPKYITKIFAVKFSKFGTGFVTFTITKISDRYEIREVKYGLSASGKNSILLLKEAGSHIQMLFENNQ